MFTASPSSRKYGSLLVRVGAGAGIHLLLVGVLFALVGTCFVRASFAADQGSAPPKAVRGTILAVSADQLTIKTTTGATTVTLAHPFRVYTRVPSDLAHVKDSSFVGVTSVKQSNGAELATEIHIFPPELRGLGEGSHMMTPVPGAPHSRMTNGSVSAPGTHLASPSRMSNGSVKHKNGSTIVVTYRGGSQTITVPPNTSVTTLQVTSKKLSVGDKVFALVSSGPKGSLVSSTAILAAK